MLYFILKRLLSLLPLLLAVTLLVFLLIQLTPGDILSEARAAPDIPHEYILTMEKQFGLDKPWYTQYLLWLKSIASLNFGESWTYRTPVSNLIQARLPATLTLALSSLLFSWIVAIPLGILAAIKKNSLIDKSISLFSAISLSIPEFFLALLAILLAAKSGLFPIGGRSSIIHDFLPPLSQFSDYLHHLILPTLVLSLNNIASLSRLTKINFLEHAHSDYVLTARAKGLPNSTIFFKHILRNALNPLIATLGLSLTSLLSGALLVENIMNYPGLGQLIYEAFSRQDQFVVMAAVFISCLTLILGNLSADLLLAWSDPRVRSKIKNS